MGVYRIDENANSNRGRTTARSGFNHGHQTVDDRGREAEFASERTRLDPNLGTFSTGSGFVSVGTEGSVLFGGTGVNLGTLTYINLINHGPHTVYYGVNETSLDFDKSLGYVNAGSSVVIDNQKVTDVWVRASGATATSGIFLHGIYDYNHRTI